MARSIDIGTFFLVKGETDDVLGGTSFTIERNAFLQAATSDDTEETLSENNWSYAKYKDKYYILGEDALKLKNLLTIKSKPENDGIIITQVGELRRPMKAGILNTSEEKLSVAIIQTLIANLVGKPSKPKEVICFCVPGDPVDSDLSVIFHRTILTNFLKSLGYEVECIPEALAIIYSERPVAEDESEEDGIAPFSGIGISYGAGMSNLCYCWKKMPLISFSVTRGGDYIDQQASKVAGVDVSVITRYKEKHFDLNNVDYSDMKEAALDIFYQNMIEYTLNKFSEKFTQLDNQIDVPLEIVIAGGTASVPGFLPSFKKKLGEMSLTFAVKSVRLADEPLYAVANGCLIKAMSVEGKKIESETKISESEIPVPEIKDKKIKIRKN